MSLFLQILGALFLLLVIVVIAALMLLRARLRGLASELEQAVAGMPPTYIHLAPVGEIAWRDPAVAGEFLRPLPMLGFVDAGQYEIVEMPEVPLAAFIQPETDVVAVVYEHPQVGAILDMVTRYADGTSITYTTTTEVGQLEERPGHEKVSAPEASAEGLYRRLLGERPRGETVAIAPDEFADVFEQAYADEMQWRIAKGGASEEEIRAIAEHSGIETTPEQVETLRAMYRGQARARLDEELHERFAAETTMSVAQWESVDGCLVFVHDQLTAEELRERFEEWTGEGWPEGAPAGTPRQQFAAANTTVPEDQRLTLVGTVSGPVEADVYAAPAWEED